MGCLILLASQFNMHHLHRTVSMACCAASSAAFCSSASRSVSYQLPSCLDKGRFNKQPFTKELAKRRCFRNLNSSSKHSNLWAFFPFTLVVQKMISCNRCQVGANFGGIVRHSNCHHISEPSMKLRLDRRGIVKAPNIKVKVPTHVTHV